MFLKSANVLVMFQQHRNMNKNAAFGLWADDSAEHYAIAAAIDILKEALDRCRDEPIPPAMIDEALDYLASQSDKAAIHCQGFQHGLITADPHNRYIRVSRALHGIAAQFQVHLT